MPIGDTADSQSALRKNALQEVLVGEPEGAVVFHDAEGIGAWWDFGEAVAVELDFVEAGEEFAEWVFVQEEITHVDGDDFGFHEIEVVVEALSLQIGLIGVPADADVFVSGDVHDGFDVGKKGSVFAVDFQADLDAEVVAKVAEFTEGFADLFEGFFLGDFFGQAVRADLDAGRADVMGEDHIVFGGGDIFFEFVLIGSVIIEGAAKAHELDVRHFEALPDLGAFSFGEVDFDFMGVSGAQLHTVKICGLTVFDDGFDVPVLGQVIGDKSEAHRGLFGQKGRWLRRYRGEGWESAGQAGGEGGLFKKGAAA